MLQNTKAGKYTYSLQSMADFRCRVQESQFDGLNLNIDGHDAWFRLIGTLMHITFCRICQRGFAGQDPLQVLTILSRVEPVDGRFNYINGPGNITAIVDYAHTPDALKNVLETITTSADIMKN